jgi:hypothetical protein
MPAKNAERSSQLMYIRTQGSQRKIRGEGLEVRGYGLELTDMG